MIADSKTRAIKKDLNLTTHEALYPTAEIKDKYKKSVAKLLRLEVQP